MSVKNRRIHGVKAKPEDRIQGQPPPLFDWPTAAGMSMKKLKQNLCSDGHATNGAACHTCESPCAFGREYNLGENRTLHKRPPPPKKPPTPAIPVRAINPDGTIHATYPSKAAAAKDMGITSDRIQRAITMGYRCKGFRWRAVSDGLA